MVTAIDKQEAKRATYRLYREIMDAVEDGSPMVTIGLRDYVLYSVERKSAWQKKVNLVPLVSHKWSVLSFLVDVV